MKWEIDETRNKAEKQADETREKAEIRCLHRLCAVLDLQAHARYDCTSNTKIKAKYVIGEKRTVEGAVALAE